MAETVYTRISPGDFDNLQGPRPQGEALAKEIEADPTIVVGLSAKRVLVDGAKVHFHFKDSLPAAEEAALNDVCAAHQGVAPVNNAVRTDGVTRVQSTPLRVPSRKLTVVGGKVDCLPDQVTELDFVWPEDREVTGASFAVANHEAGDYLDFIAVAPTGQPAPSDFVEVAKFGETIYVPPDGRLPMVVAEGAEEVPAGLVLRFCYHAITAGSARTLYGYLRTHKDAS